MQRLTTVASWRDAATAQREVGHRIGLVPTMGALHDGHVSLIRAAREQCDVVFVTIFVNPRQFSASSDLATYPTPRENDRAVCERLGVEILVEPTVDEMWPDGANETATTVQVRGVTDRFEGEGRPGHFDGVASVVTKLFAITGQCHAYFGEKDFQQLKVVERLVRDLALPVVVHGCPLVRDVDGLALSSRNVRLTASGRANALGLSRALAHVSDGVLRSAPEIRRTLSAFLANFNLEVAYADVVHPDTLVPLTANEHGPGRVLLAAHVEGTRLLDNGPVNVGSSKGASCY